MDIFAPRAHSSAIFAERALSLMVAELFPCLPDIGTSFVLAFNLELGNEIVYVASHFDEFRVRLFASRALLPIHE